MSGFCIVILKTIAYNTMDQQLNALNIKLPSNLTAHFIDNGSKEDIATLHYLFEHQMKELFPLEDELEVWEEMIINKKSPTVPRVSFYCWKNCFANLHHNLQVLVFVDSSLKPSNNNADSNNIGPFIIGAALYEYYIVSDSIMISYIFTIKSHRSEKISSLLRDYMFADSFFLSKVYTETYNLLDDTTKPTLDNAAVIAKLKGTSISKNSPITKLIHEISTGEERTFLMTLARKVRLNRQQYNMPISGIYAETLNMDVDDGVFPTKTRHAILSTLGTLQVNVDYVQPPGSDMDDGGGIPDAGYVLLVCEPTAVKEKQQQGISNSTSNNQKLVLKENLILFLIEYACFFDANMLLAQVLDAPYFQHVLQSILNEGKSDKLYTSELPWTRKSQYVHKANPYMKQILSISSKL